MTTKYPMPRPDLTSDPALHNELMSPLAHDSLVAYVTDPETAGVWGGLVLCAPGDEPEDAGLIASSGAHIMAGLRRFVVAAREHGYGDPGQEVHLFLHIPAGGAVADSPEALTPDNIVGGEFSVCVGGADAGFPILPLPERAVVRADGKIFIPFRDMRDAADRFRLYARACDAYAASGAWPEWVPGQVDSGTHRLLPNRHDRRVARSRRPNKAR